MDNKRKALSDFVAKKKKKQELANPEDGGDVRYVKFSSRANATLIDLIISSILFIPFFQFISTTLKKLPPHVVQAKEKFLSGEIDHVSFFEILNYYYLNEGGIEAAFLEMGVQLIIVGITIILLWYWKGATPGKMFLSMKIVDAETLGEPTKAQWIIRYFAYILSFVPLFLGFFWIAFDKKRQGWHDKIAKTVVIYTKKEEENAKEKKFKRQTIIAIITIIAFLTYVSYLKN